MFPLLLQNKLAVSGVVEFRQPKTVPSGSNSGADTLLKAPFVLLSVTRHCKLLWGYLEWHRSQIQARKPNCRDDMLCNQSQVEFKFWSRKSVTLLLLCLQPIFLAPHLENRKVGFL